MTKIYSLLRYDNVKIASMRNYGCENGQGGHAASSCRLAAVERESAGRGCQDRWGVSANRISMDRHPVRTWHRLPARDEQGRPTIVDIGRAGRRSATCAVVWLLPQRQQIWPRSLGPQVGTSADRGALRYQVRRRPCLAHPWRNVGPKSAAVRAHPRAQRGDWPIRKLHLDSIQKVRREGREIVFIDGPGLSERPAQIRSWVAKGRTTLIQFMGASDTSVGGEEESGGERSEGPSIPPPRRERRTVPRNQQGTSINQIM